MATLMNASHQWATRPDEERFTSLLDMHATMVEQRACSRAAVVPTRHIQVIPDDDNKGLMIAGPAGASYAPTNAAFGQLATLAQAPAGYLRTLPSPIAADALNYGFQFARDVEDVGLLLYKNGAPILRAATGPLYGRTWNSDIVGGLIKQFGDGVSGDWRVPGEFGKAVEVSKANTTLYASDRDMFVFLADEVNRIEIPGRRDGRTGSMARGFFVWNSETGGSTFGVKTFLFDYVCCNRIVWGADGVEEFKLRHTASAPVRFLEEITPALQQMARSSETSIIRSIEDARSHRLDNVGDFLAKRYGPRVAQRIDAAHMADEGRPMETRWDVVTGVTAYARQMPYQSDRVDIETDAGKLLQTV